LQPSLTGQIVADQCPLLKPTLKNDIYDRRNHQVTLDRELWRNASPGAAPFPARP
jgi:hypothetical protein